ncbi:unnamed protein product [Cuscuta campestris]|uniref:Uncharacterized protein n=1 Tax=Cuscuta campestris TaxID=132261 RepID=A0A484LQ06_9ASTE|nr:unnamed protein product [Cuscuta campestris]
MGLIFATKSILAQLSHKFQPIGIRSLCSNNQPPSNNIGKKNDVVDASSSLTPYDTYKELDNLNFMKAAKILFSDPPKKKKFGLDFHLVQFFFACLPSLAVYLVAQYARYDMRRMEAENELKKKAEEEAAAKAKEIEETSELEKELSDKKLLDLKARLDKLEETVKAMVVESKKESPVAIRKEPPIGNQGKQPSIAGERNTSNNGTQAGNSDAENNPNKKSTG